MVRTGRMRTIVIGGVPGSLVGGLAVDLEGFPDDLFLTSCPAPAIRSRLLARGAPDRGRTARRNRGRPSAGRGRRTRTGLGELPLARHLRRPLRVASRTRRSAPRPHVGHLGRRRAARDLLLRRRTRAEARVRRGRPARPAPRTAPGRGGGRRNGGTGAALPRAERARTDGGRLGDPHRNRHRVRPGRAGRHQHPSARRACGSSCSRWQSSTICWPSPSSRSSTPPSCTWFRCCSPCSRSGCSRCWSSVGCGRGGCCSPWPRPPGRWCTRPGCTPPSPACCWASPFR